MATYSSSSANRASMGSILKPIFDKQAKSLLSEEYNFYKFIKESDGEKIKLDGEDFVISVQTNRNDRSEWFAEEGALPLSGAPNFVQAKIRAARIAQPMQINHELKMLADRDQATFATRLEMLWQDARIALARTLNKAAVSDGTGVLTTSTGTTSAAATSTLAVADSSVFEENQSLDIYATALGTKRNSTAGVTFVVVSVDSATQITLGMSDGSNVPNTVISGDKIFRAGSIPSTTSTTYIGMNGLQGITASGGTTFMGLSGTTYAKWNAVRVDAAGAQIGPRLLGRAQIAARRVNNSGAKLNTIWMSPEQSLEVVYGGAGTYPDVRFSRDDAAKASVKNQNKPSFNFGNQEIDVQVDLDLPVTKAIMFPNEALFVGQLHDVQLEDFDGQTALPVVSSGRYLPADISWLTWRANMGCFARNEFVEVYGLPTPA